MANPRGITLEKKIMGGRPDFSTGMPTEKVRNLTLVKGLNWHGFYFDAKKDFSFFKKFVQAHGFCTSDQTKNIQNPEFLSGSVVSLAKMVEDGWILSPLEHKKIVDHVADLLSRGARISSEEAAKESNQVPSAPKMRQQIVAILQYFDVEEELWFKERRVPITKELDDFKALIFEAKPSKSEMMEILEFLEKRRQEYADAYSKNDEDLIEGYELFGQRLLGVAIKRINMFQVAVTSVEQKTKTVRKARKLTTVKKLPAKIDAQLKNLKFLPASSEFDIASVDPKKIIGAKVLITYNTKYKSANIYHSKTPEGFSIKGTTLQNFDETKSKTRGIRKPKDVVPMLKSKTLPQIEQMWSRLTTVEREAKGRINEDTLLIRVI
jgi:hypothetical protein